MKKLLYVVALGFMLTGCASRLLAPVHVLAGGQLQTQTEGKTMEEAREQANYTAYQLCKSEKKRHVVVKIAERDTRPLGANNTGRTGSDAKPFKVELTFKCQ